jgi:hypothetical protein
MARKVLAAKRDAPVLVEDGLLQPLHKAIGPRMARLGPRDAQAQSLTSCGKCAPEFRSASKASAKDRRLLACAAVRDRYCDEAVGIGRSDGRKRNACAKLRTVIAAAPTGANVRTASKDGPTVRKSPRTASRACNVSPVTHRAPPNPRPPPTAAMCASAKPRVHGRRRAGFRLNQVSRYRTVC